MDYNERITTRGNGNAQSHDQEESKSSSTINANSGAHALHTTKQQKTLFGKTNAATVETSKILTKTLLLGPVK